MALSDKQGFDIADKCREVIYESLRNLDLSDRENQKGCLELCRGLMRMLGDIRTAANLQIVTVCYDTELSIEPKPRKPKDD